MSIKSFDGNTVSFPNGEPKNIVVRSAFWEGKFARRVVRLFFSVWKGGISWKDFFLAFSWNATTARQRYGSFIDSEILKYDVRQEFMSIFSGNRFMQKNG